MSDSLADPSPRPWTVGHLDDTASFIFDARSITVCYEAGPYPGSVTEADAQLIVTAVNERDALLADRDALAAQVEAVKALHRPCSPVFSLHGGLALQEPCPDCRGKAGTHPCGCWSPTDVEYECRECISAPTSKGRPVVPYPCPTIRALEGES